MSTRYRILEQASFGPDSPSVFYPEFSDAWFGGWRKFLTHTPASWRCYETFEQANAFICEVTKSNREYAMRRKAIDKRTKSHAFDPSNCGQTYL